ncbi:ABC transporter permease [Patescibacteria group bacterium]|nr:FtsX-like permease family protein [Candidatus Falkowbacteria bacterium]MBU3905452.1 ABC transporter permease [Patescibacteria group bacterium]MBU4015317.1 ABC transporter permease [Patescibacteria group bacterium]MBU4026019.1 ABC transporter permease [Patescibacteria group bacterium]MBU4072996.1 ABC transporter permease [Patescibacteria group bacterium]
MFSKFSQSVATSITALLANKARSFLTMLGIIIGVGAVIVIMAVGAGAQSLILAQVETLGTNLIGVMPGKSDEAGPPTSAMGIVITTLTYEDVMALREKSNVPNAVDVVGYTNGTGTANWGSNSYDTNLKGVTVGYIEVEGGELDNGRFFSKEEETNLSRVAVIGSTVKKELFGESEVIGQRIKIKKHTFEVIGVMAERGTVAFQDYDDQILMPIKTMQKLIAGVNYLGLIRIKIDSEENIDRAISDVEMTLRDQHDIADLSGDSDDFSVRSAAEALDMITVITDALRYFLAAMAALSLIVGGIGIMNIMLVSVTERTREIGLRKAVGANNFNIMSQFLIEAVVVTLLGGIIGIIGGAVFSYLIAVIANFMGYDWAFVVSLLSIVLAIAVSTAVGLIFGLYPARKASMLEPVEALRYE